MKHISDSELLHGSWLDIPPRETIHQRFLQYVEQSDGCWNWTGSRLGNYGGFHVRRLQDERGSTRVSAHRWSFTYYKGNIPDGLVLDHLCGNTLCVNPEHLEPVTQAENLRRAHARQPRGYAGTRYISQRKPLDAGEFCNKGLHPWTTENVWFKSNGTRVCRPCKREYERTRRKRERHDHSHATH